MPPLHRRSFSPATRTIALVLILLVQTVAAAPMATAPPPLHHRGLDAGDTAPPRSAPPHPTDRGPGSRSDYREEGEVLVLENSLIRLEFDRPHHGALRALVDRASGTGFRTDPGPDPLLFELLLSNGTSRWVVSGNDATSFSYYGEDRAFSSSLEMSLSGVGDPLLNVTARIEVHDGDPGTIWGLEVMNGNSSLTVLEARYPLVTGMTPDIEGNHRPDHLSVPLYEGAVYEDPHSLLLSGSAPLEFQYPGELSMQFMAIHDGDGPGLFLSTRDRDGQFKRYFMEDRGPAHNVTVGISHLAPEVPGEDLVPGYGTVLSVFNGGWHRAAEMYRSWALEGPWTSAGPLEERTDLPEWWLGPRPMILLETRNRTGALRIPMESWSTIVADHVDGAGTNLTLQVTGWERNGTGTAPFVLPPHGGDIAVRDEIKEVGVAGGKVMFSTSGARWRLEVPDIGYNSTDEFNALGRPHAAKDRSGAPIIDPVSEELDMPAAVMDPSTDWWHDTVVSRTGEVADMGVDIHGLEDIPTRTWVPCHDETHGHSPGWGAHVSDAHRTLVSDMVSAGRTVNSDMVLTTTSPSELLLDNVHGYISAENAPELSPLYRREIADHGDAFGTAPMFTFVFHRHIPSYGLPPTMEKGDELPALYNSSARGLATSFVGGRAVSARSLGPGNDDPSLLQLFRRAARTTAGEGRDYLLLGEMLEPAEVPSPLIEVPYPVPSDNGTSWHSLHERQVVNSAWMSRDGTRMAHAVANWGNQTLDTVLELPAYTLPEVNFSIVVHRNGRATTLVPSTTLPSSTNITLGPRDVVLVEVLSAPDVVVESILPEPTEPVVGQTVTVHVEVANRGSVDMDMTNLFLYQNGTYFDNRSLGTLGPDSNASVTFRWPGPQDASVGTYNLTARVWPRTGEILTENNQMSTSVQVLPRPVGQVRVTVIDDRTLAPLEGSEVLLLDPADGALLEFALTMPGRDVVFEDLVPGTYGVNASKEGYIPEENMSVVVSAYNTTHVSLALTPIPVVPTEGDLKGTVLDNRTSGPLAGARVHLVQPDRTYYTGLDGIYEFPSIRAGNYSVQVTRHGYRPAWANVTVQPGKVNWANITLEMDGAAPRTGTIMGQVLSTGDDTPVPDARIELLENGTVVFTNTTGNFLLEDLPLGLHTLNITAEGHVGTHREVEVVTGENPVTVHLDRLPEPGPMPVDLEGFVVDRGGEPVAAATVHVEWDRDNGTTYTDASGHYSMEDVGPGIVTVRIERTGYRTADRELTAQGPGSLWLNVTLETDDTGATADGPGTVTSVLVGLNALMIAIVVILLVQGRARRYRSGATTRGRTGKRIKKKVRAGRVAPPSIDEGGPVPIDREISAEE